jgi:hypothetical protein
MQITLTIPEELAAQARKRGISPEAYVQSIIEHARREAPSSTQPRTREQIDAFFMAVAEGSESLPSLPTASLTRESFYEDRSFRLRTFMEET